LLRFGHAGERLDGADLAADLDGVKEHGLTSPNFTVF
jgi:hypothetical protein